jgi:hypothetical protein
MGVAFQAVQPVLATQWLGTARYPPLSSSWDGFEKRDVLYSRPGEQSPDLSIVSPEIVEPGFEGTIGPVR